jgi:hypothetical protein
VATYKGAYFLIEEDPMASATPLPTGTVTFLFTDIEGSTRLWEQHPADKKTAIIFEVDAGCVVHLPIRAGSVLIFTEALTHGTLDWAAPYERRALLYKYSPAHESWGRAGRSEELLAQMTERQRRILEPPYVWKRQPIPVEETD